MAYEKDNAIFTARRFVALLKTNGINVSEAYVFGSAILNKSDDFPCDTAMPEPNP
ncbi:MAG: hypothetical protein J0651_03235 [Actinobacteria bacterium]|nr:hypothetical protein [Actinomycetota bacterium]